MDSQMRRIAVLLLIIYCLVIVPVGQAAGVTLVVNTTSDSGDGKCDATACTLREAIMAANLTPETDTIAFELPGDPPYRIEPANPLPDVIVPVVIDGTTQPEYAGKPIIEISGAVLIRKGYSTG